MSKLRPDDATLALLRLAAAIAAGDADAVGECAAAAQAGAMPLEWGEELVLQSVLMIGWPRALVAAAAWRRGVGASAVGTDTVGPEGWQERGETVCRTIYGHNYERLRSNVHVLHPMLNEWMVTYGYGRTLGRPGLDLARRELCTVVQTAILDTPRQLHSHLRGALNAGATPESVAAALTAATEYSSPSVRTEAAELWSRIRDRKQESS